MSTYKLVSAPHKKMATPEQIEQAIKAAKFKIGDVVFWTNDYGTKIGERTITGITSRYGDDILYFLSPSDAPWSPINENNLTQVKER